MPGRRTWRAFPGDPRAWQFPVVPPMTGAMPVTAVLFDIPPPALSTEPLCVGGITILERQMRQIRRAGIAMIVVVARDGVVAPQAAGDFLVIEGGIIFDDRIIRAVLAAPAPAVATWPVTRPGTAARTTALTTTGTERLDAASSAAGIGLYPAALVSTVVANLGSWDFASTLRRSALAGGAARIDLAALDRDEAGTGNVAVAGAITGTRTHAGEKAGGVAGQPPLIWTRPDDAAGAAMATKLLVDAARMKRDDWAGRCIDAPINARVAEWLVSTPVTPLMVTLFVLALAFTATAAFAAGALWPGLLLALATGMLDGVDRMLARVRLEPARLSGRLHPFIAGADYAWFAAVGVRFAVTRHASGPIAVAALIVGFALADRLQDAFFHRLTGGVLAISGNAERRLRLFGAGRDTRLWAWLPFAVAGAWVSGLVALAVYTAATFFIAQRRLFNRLGVFFEKPLVSVILRNNEFDT